MKVFLERILGVIFDVRVIIGFCGLLLSVIMHEIVHVMMHLGQIEQINLLPDGVALVEIILAHSADNDLIAEEMIAYIITMMVLIMTAMLVCEVGDSRSTKTPHRTIINKCIGNNSSSEDELRAYNQLSSLLGIEPLLQSSTEVPTKKI